jgi:hypothetical protein
MFGIVSSLVPARSPSSASSQAKKPATHRRGTERIARQHEEHDGGPSRSSGLDNGELDAPNSVSL